MHNECGLSVLVSPGAQPVATTCLPRDSQRRAALNKVIKVKVIKVLIHLHGRASFGIDVIHYTPDGGICQGVFENFPKNMRENGNICRGMVWGSRRLWERGGRMRICHAYRSTVSSRENHPTKRASRTRLCTRLASAGLLPGCCRATAGLLPGLSQANDHTSNPAYFSTSSEKMEFAQANHSRL